MSVEQSYPLLPPSAFSGLTVEGLFRQLSYGELSNLSVAVDATGTIKKDQQNRIVHFANEGLKALFTRFPLGEEMEILQLFGESLEHPLPEEALQITDILTEHGESLPFTTAVEPGRIYVHKRTLHIPAQELRCRHGLREGAEIQVLFRTRHPALVPIRTSVDLEQEINIPTELEAALTSYIAFKMYGTMNNSEHLAAAANYRNQYELVCAEAQHHGLLPTEIRTSAKFNQRGWI